MHRCRGQRLLRLERGVAIGVGVASKPPVCRSAFQERWRYGRAIATVTRCGPMTGGVLVFPRERGLWPEQRSSGVAYEPATFPSSAHRSNAAPQHSDPVRNIHPKEDRSRTSRPTIRWRIPMKTMVLAAVAASSLSVGAAYAQGARAEAGDGVPAFTAPGGVGLRGDEGAAARGTDDGRNAAWARIGQ
jgi:hypothetical protein